MKVGYLLCFIGMVSAMPSGHDDALAPDKLLTLDYASITKKAQVKELTIVDKLNNSTQMILQMKPKVRYYSPRFHYPLTLKKADQVAKLAAQIDINEMHDWVTHMSSYYNRYYKSADGVAAASWVYENLKLITQPIGNATVTRFMHNGWPQYSVIVKIQGRLTPENIVVFGSHIDSASLVLPRLLPSPGADDDASGCATLFEALNLYVQYLKETKDYPANTIEFHFYSAEEGGLLGSHEVFKQYFLQEKNVVAMLQQDMTGYVDRTNVEHVGLMTDYTDPHFNDFLKRIIDYYLSIPYVESYCGYACSDHVSAHLYGFPSGFVLESRIKDANPFADTCLDTVDKLDFAHMAQHVKLVIATLLELGSWDPRDL